MKELLFHIFAWLAGFMSLALVIAFRAHWRAHCERRYALAHRIGRLILALVVALIACGAIVAGVGRLY